MPHLGISIVILAERAAACRWGHGPIELEYISISLASCYQTVSCNLATCVCNVAFFNPHSCSFR
uniref:Uncharacterized protein n=1 Tax=Arundo donax TaxID=35708 RepID=A0A0A9FEX7_ARUDO